MRGPVPWHLRKSRKKCFRPTSSAEYYLGLVSIRKDNPEFKLTLDLLNVGLSKIKVANTYYEYSYPEVRNHMIELRKKTLTEDLHKIPDSLRSPADLQKN